MKANPSISPKKIFNNKSKSRQIEIRAALSFSPQIALRLLSIIDKKQVFPYTLKGSNSLWNIPSAGKLDLEIFFVREPYKWYIYCVFALSLSYIYCDFAPSLSLSVCLGAQSLSHTRARSVPWGGGNNIIF